MPIKPENRDRYPADWPAIRVRILERDGHRCAHCGVPNGAVGYRTDDGGFCQLGTSVDAAGERIDAATADGHKVIRIVLTIAHLADPDPANCADDNLAALCQRCHNLHDMPMRLANAAATRKARKASGDLFTTGAPPNEPARPAVPEPPPDEDRSPRAS